MGTILLIVFDFRVLSLVDLKLSFENRSVCLPLPQLHAPQGSFDIDIDACMIMYVLFFSPLTSSQVNGIFAVYPWI